MPVWIGSSPEFGARPTGVRLTRLEASPNWSDDRFVDGFPRAHAGYLGDLLARLSARDTTPRLPLPVERRRRRDFIGPPRGGLRITWLGHSSLLVEMEGYRLLVDPVWSRRASPLPFGGPTRFHPPPLPIADLPRIDAVVISHDHYDHLDRSSIVAIAPSVDRFVVPLGVGAHLEYWGVETSRITELDWWDETELGHLRVVATPARHASGRSLVSIRTDTTLWAGWAILGRERRAYVSGDSAMFTGFAEVGDRFGPFDVTFIPIGGYVSGHSDLQVGPEQAVQAHLNLRGRLLFPVHWATFSLTPHAWTEPIERALVAAAEAGVAIVVPMPGQGVEPSAPPRVEQWWPEVPWNSATDDPVVSTGLDGQP